MEEMPDFENESAVKLRWYIEKFPSPHPFFRPAMAALERKEAAESRTKNRPAIHIEHSNVANLNVGSQIGAIAADTTGKTADEFNDQLRQVVRIAELEWSLLNRRDNWVTPQTICRRVDELCAALTLLYGKCPIAIDSKPLRVAIEKLHETRKHRVGNLIGSKSEIDAVGDLMQAALDVLHSMVQE